MGDPENLNGEAIMVCPYFMPTEKLEDGNWPHPARLPLGGGWRGHCTAPGHENETPAQDVLEASCNLGYASACTWAPSDRAWDAVRFALAAPAPKSSQENDIVKATEETSARVICISYVCERAHRPVEHGRLEFDAQASVWRRSHGDSRVQTMAECFLKMQVKKNAG
jgi:hypothetical protein